MPNMLPARSAARFTVSVRSSAIDNPDIAAVCTRTSEITEGMRHFVSKMFAGS